ncbi:MAG: M13 family peptidase, partial [Sphingopyxis sp.]
MKKAVLAILLSTAAIVAGPVACSKGGDKAAATYTVGTELGISKDAMDTSVKPGDDFYAYANGNWQKTTAIPADRSSIGAFYIAFLETEKRTRELVDTIVKSGGDPKTDDGRIAAFYNAYMNTKAIDAARMKPVEADLARYAAITDKASLSKVLGENTRADVDPLNATDFATENLFGIFVTQGLATPGDVIPYVLQGGLGLPEREYYLSADPKMATIRTQYQAYIAKLLTAAGEADADAKAKRIFDLEVKIAKAHASREESEDFAKSASVWTKADFAKKAPGIDWDAYLAAAGLDKAAKFGAYHAKAISGLSALVASEPLDAWKDWLTFHQINSHTDVLPTALDTAHFAFYGTTLSGTPQQQVRWKRAVNATNGALSDAVGKLYVAKYFPPESKAKVQAMVADLIAAFRVRIDKL